MTEQHNGKTEAGIGRREAFAVLACCAVASLIAIAWSWTTGSMLNYGDAVAHLHIARRIIDARHPGISELGSVWLPLPHLIMVPFVAVYAWWANGIAGLIPSALAWLASCFGFYRLARKWLSPLAASVGLAFFALNPNLLYMQTTAMNEPLFVCLMVWTVLWLVEWRGALAAQNDRRAGRLLLQIATVLVASVFTRYDGWIMTAIAWTAIGVILLRAGKLRSGAFWTASFFVLAAPVVWFAYNARIFGDWLAFMRGPYSAKAIELRTALPGGPPHPGWHDLWISFLFYVKSAMMDATTERWGTALLVLSVVGVLWGWLIARKKAYAWTLLLWMPAAFYAYSVAYGSIPIFLPVWWPHSYYNTRYGLELLPGFALALAFAAGLLFAAVREFQPRWQPRVAAAVFALLGLGIVFMLRERALVYVESTKNIEARRPYEEAIPPRMRTLLAGHPDAPVLMITSVYPEIVALTGIPLRQTINEGDYKLYNAALAAPAQHAYLVLAFDGDPVAQAVHAHPQGLRQMARFTARTQPGGTLYVSDTWHPAGPSSAPAR